MAFIFKVTPRLMLPVLLTLHLCLMVHCTSIDEALMMCMNCSDCNVITLQVYLPVASGCSFLLGLFLATTVCLCCRWASPRKPRTAAHLLEPGNLSTAAQPMDTAFESPAADVPTYYNAASSTYAAETTYYNAASSTYAAERESVLGEQSKQGYDYIMSLPPVQCSISQPVSLQSSITQCKAVPRHPGYVNVLAIQSPASQSAFQVTNAKPNTDRQWRMPMCHNKAYSARKDNLC